MDREELILTGQIEVDLDHAEVLSSGSFGRVYLLSDELILKTYFGDAPLMMAKAEIVQAKKVFSLGVPCAIPYRIIETKQGPGVIFERVNGGSLAKAMNKSPENLGSFLDSFVVLAKKMWATEVPAGILPPAKEKLLLPLTGLRSALGDTLTDNLRAFIEALPDGNRFLHMDFHWSNVMISKNECLLIDVPDSAAGHPALDLLTLAHAYYLCPRRPLIKERFNSIFRFDMEYADDIWNTFCERYFEDLIPSVAEARKRTAELLSPLFLLHVVEGMMLRGTDEEEILKRLDEIRYFSDRMLYERDLIFNTLNDWTL